MQELEKGFLSIWIGKFENIKKLRNYLAEGYTEDGDIIYSEFKNEFDLEIFEKYNLIVNYNKENIIDFEEIFSKLPEKKLITKNFEKEIALKSLKIRNYNTVIIIFDYNYGKNVKSENLGFKGSIRYE